MGNKLKKIIQEVLSEIMMDEAAVGYEDAARLGLGIVERVDGDKIILSLHNFSSDKNVGVIILDEKDSGYEVGGVFADKGYGPLMYRVAMSRVYPSYVFPDRVEVSEQASSVWKKFYQNPSIEHIPIKDNEFHRDEHLNQMYRMRGGDFSRLEVSGLGDREERKIIELGRSRFESYLNDEY